MDKESFEEYLGISIEEWHKLSQELPPRTENCTFAYNTDDCPDVYLKNDYFSSCDFLEGDIIVINSTNNSTTYLVKFDDNKKYYLALS